LERRTATLGSPFFFLGLGFDDARTILAFVLAHFLYALRIRLTVIPAKAGIQCLLERTAKTKDAGSLLSQG
jgi:hypothetical protein